MTDICNFARALILECGTLLRDKRRQCNFSVQEKNGYSDIVTDHDVWVQHYLCERILRRYPDHSIIGEEDMCRVGTSCWKWVIDPIDGTTNYCQFGKHYAISIAILCSEQPVYGFVLDVENACLYEGGDPPQDTQCAGRELTEEGILHMGFKSMQDFARDNANPYALAECFRGVRYLGCASLELCGIADEQAGVYINSHLKVWDFAAAQAILRSRGCHIAAAEMPNGKYFVCAYRSPSIYQACIPYFPEEVRRKLNENGGTIFHVTN